MAKFLYILNSDFAHLTDAELGDAIRLQLKAEVFAQQDWMDQDLAHRKVGGGLTDQDADTLLTLYDYCAIESSLLGRYVREAVDRGLPVPPSYRRA